MKEFKEPTSEAIPVYCPKGMRMCTLNLRNERDQVHSAVALDPIGGPKEPSQTGKGKEPIQHAPELSTLMNFIIWNIRGANNASFRRQCDTMVKMHKPAMLVLLETRMTEHNRLTQALHFDAQIQSTANGLSGGIVIMWKEYIL